MLNGLLSGQPQQRPPNLAQNPGLASQFRPPYPAYPLPPRNVNPLLPGAGYTAGLQPTTHRAPTQQSPVQNINPGFMQQRAPSSFGFGSGLGQHQSNATIQQQSSSHQQQTNGSSTSLPPHLTQTPNLGAPSVSNDVGLDPNDFPALGSTTANSASNGANGSHAGSSVATSYATQAGTGVPLGGAAIGAGGATQTRDFTPDDFPALGGQAAQPNSQNQSSSQDNQLHPPGLNGFQHSEHRQNLLGNLGGGVPSGTPGMLNIGQSRNVHPGFQQGQTEVDKQQQRVRSMILNLFVPQNLDTTWWQLRHTKH